MAAKRPLYLEIMTDEPTAVLKTLIDAGYMPKICKWSEDIADLFKAMVRPIIIVSSWAALLFMWINHVDIPPVLLGVGLAITGEYGLERAYKRWKKPE